jgi:polyhydroxyalkanoate synthesis regulator protein
MSQPAGLAAYEDQVKKNMALFSQAMQMFSPFAYSRPDAPAAGAPESGPTAAPAAAATPAAAPVSGNDDAIADLKRRMEEMAAQIDRLASGR